MQAEDTKEKAIDLLAKLAQTHGAPGYENAVRRIFRDEIRENLSTDRTGNIVGEKKGAADSPRIILTAHMDEVGFVVQTITKSGLIKFAPLGGWWPHAILAQRVRILTKTGEEILGVIGAKPPHFLEESEREKVLKLDKMFIDIGAKDADEVRDRFGIQLGDSIVPASSFERMGNPDYLLCKAFDNRVGMALIIQAIEKLRSKALSHPNTVLSVGTVQEELGMRGAQTAVFGLDLDAAIVLEGTPADDLPEVNEDERQGVVGEGVQIRLLDPSAIMNRQFAAYVVGVADELGIPHQIAVRKSGGTDARVIHLHGAGIPTVVLGVPARYIHTHNSIIHINDYLSTLDLLLNVIQRLDKEACDHFTLYAD
jgi:endoglucanase